MVHEVILPKLGQTMEEGTVVDWLKQEGDAVQRGEVLFTVESDKATLEVEASTRGFLRRILVPAGQTVPVLTVVALITRTADEELSAYKSQSQVSGSGLQVAEAPAPVSSEPETFNCFIRGLFHCRNFKTVFNIYTQSLSNLRIILFCFALLPYFLRFYSVEFP